MRWYFSGIFIICTFLLLGIFFASLVEAKFSVNKNESVIETNYLEGDFVRGKISMNFSNQEDAKFSSSFDGGINLVKLLHNMNLSAEYFTCDPLSCEEDFKVLEYTLNEIQEIELGEERLFGFQIKESGNFRGIEKNGFSFNLTVNAQPSCDNQVEIDLFNDGEVDLYNTQATSDCVRVEKDYGCFDEDEATDSVLIGNELYCEKISGLPPAPGYRVGANVAQETGEKGKLNFVMYSADGSKQLGFGGIDSPPNDASVTIDYSSLEKFDAIVCIWAPSGQQGLYSIRVNEGEDSCGIQLEHGEVLGEEFNVDYEVYARPLAYKQINELELNAKTYKEATGKDLEEEIENYLNLTYKNNCSGEFGCVIPFKVSGESQSGQKIHSGSTKYNTGAGVKTTNYIYQLDLRPARVTTKKPVLLNLKCRTKTARTVLF